MFNLDSPDDDRAVSPVIGVILMVAITVIMAAVIGAFVLSFGDEIEQEVQAGVTVNQDAGQDQITVSWTSQGTADGIAVVPDDVASADSYTETVGGTIVINQNVDEGDTINVVAYRPETGGTLADAQRQTVVRSITADFGIP